MAQSYGNLSTSVIAAATDEILGVAASSQTLGTSISAEEPSDILVAGRTLTINVDADGTQTITLAAHANRYDIAADIQTEVRALSPIGAALAVAFTDFTARWDERLKKLVLTSGTAVTTPSTASVVITGGTGAVPLKLGAAQAGTEARTGSEVIDYVVKYRFVIDSGRLFASADVAVSSSELTVPTDLAEVQAIADARASQMKAELTTSQYLLTDDNTLNGPVSL